MNLNTHIMLALAVGAVAFHRVDLAVLVAIGAAIPDLDREYVFTKRRVFERYQLHRALLHNVFFAGSLSLFNQYLGLGVFLHILLDLLTSPTDRGVEVLFPLGRFVRSFKLDLDGRVNRGRSRITWYMEDPVRLVRRTSDPELREEGKAPWIRVYGPFKNSRLADWTLFYSSLLFLVIYEHIHGGFLPWFLDFLRVFLLNFLPIEVGVISFYAAGEWWRRSLQFRQGGRGPIVAAMALGLILVIYQGSQLYMPPQVRLGDQVWIALLASVLGFCVAYLHVRLKHGEVII